MSSQLVAAAEATVDTATAARPARQWVTGRHAQAILLVSWTLITGGVVLVGSACASLEHPLLGPGWWRTMFGRQLIFAAASVVVLIFTARWGRSLLSWRPTRRVLPWVVLVLVLIALAATLVPGLGHTRGASSRWLQVGPTAWGVRFQPSEFAKLALIGGLAAWYGARRRDPQSLGRGFVPGALIVGSCVALVGLEDFSTAALLGIVGAGMLLVAGCRWRYLLLLGLLGAVGAGALVRAEDYRWKRLTAFRSLDDDPQDTDYHALQSLSTIAAGGWTGTGLGAGIRKYGYLPESHTDFIFAVLCEETGVLGGLAVVGLYAVLVYLGARTMQRARSRFERLLAFGITATVGVQAVIHIAVVTAAAPTTGISLPLLSAGGSGVLALSFALGLLAAVASRGRTIARRGALDA